MESVEPELIKIIPSILWFLLAVVVILMFQRTIREELLPNLATLEAGSVKLRFARNSMDAAIDLGQKSPQWHVVVPPEDKTRVLNRARKQVGIMKDAQFLWVDDHPDNNVNERRMFRRLGVDVDIATTTDEALRLLQGGSYDLVISDMARGSEKAAGLDMLRRYHSAGDSAPVIFYVGVINPTLGVPAGAFGITNRPDELLHLILDAMARKRS